MCLTYLVGQLQSRLAGVTAKSSMLSEHLCSLDEHLDSIAGTGDFDSANFTPCDEASSIAKTRYEFVTIAHGQLFGSPPFYIKTGPLLPQLEFTKGRDLRNNYCLNAPTTSGNMRRILRALQAPGRAILLEGSPGVGKTSLVLALAAASGHSVFRINLSEATEVNDLFGSDLPVEGNSDGSFAWRDGPLLQALKQGDWIILDELYTVAPTQFYKLDRSR
ncbi:unnamed protein product [Protopolystoma xenopodis]|uniref:ATPase dynein-related AAA domain-containing protein n=1 Tax=Protopolystoma xenopodis TaxID=117903 RepID=A0A448XBS1_9PLAT|nr:unnamed protein product [Protopolystoma xenopodis]